MMDQKGLSLVEVVIAVALFGIIAAGLFMALNVSHKVTGSTNRLTIAESLTRSALEVIKNCPYEYWVYSTEPPVNNPPDYQDEVDGSITTPLGYSITVSAVPIDPETHELLPIDPETGEPLTPPPDHDQGIQKVTVEVYFEGALIVTTVDYKVDR